VSLGSEKSVKAESDAFLIIDYEYIYHHSLSLGDALLFQKGLASTRVFLGKRRPPPLTHQAYQAHDARMKNVQNDIRRSL
jgi:hypothetical protein